MFYILLAIYIHVPPPTQPTQFPPKPQKTQNPELRLYKPSEMGEADPSRLLTSLMGRYAHGEHVNTVGTEGTQVNMNGQAVGGF